MTLKLELHDKLQNCKHDPDDNMALSDHPYLKQMQKKDPENKIVYLDAGAKTQAVTEARIRVCIKETKNNKYSYYSSGDIEKIARHYVEQAPRLTFEAARIELGIPSLNT